MIHVDRSKVPDPFETNPGLNEKGKKEIAEYEAQLRSGELRQQRYLFKIYRSSEIRTALMELFQGKCAYCESAIGATQLGDIEHFRPKTSVVERPEHPGYWWLVNTWDNMLLSCADCGRTRSHEGEKSGKGNRFPLEDEAKRAFEPGEEDYESPLLLDPSGDLPEKHLFFTTDGTVVSETKRGNTTIAVFGLNRPGLVQRRGQVIKSVRKLIDDLEFLSNLLNESPEDAELLERLTIQIKELRWQTEASAEYAGAKRQYIKPALAQIERLEEEVRVATDTITGDKLEWEALSPKVSKERLSRAKKSTQAYQMEMSDYSLKEEDGVLKYRLQRRLIERITIRNIRTIKDLDLNLTTMTGERTPWLMLLGENGTGKSTVLQATAMVLMGADYFRDMVSRREINPADFVRYRCKSGSVRVKLSGFQQSHELVFYKDRVTFLNPTGEATTIYFDPRGETSTDGQSWKPQTVLLGYGATRLLPRHEKNERYGGEFARVENLFNPFIPLFDAETWLLDRKRKQFDEIAIVLKDLLSLDEEAQLVKQQDHILVITPNSRVTLNQLSDGYQSMVATTVDILEIALRLWPNLGDAEGIVLLDEIGAHLHPTWKMKIVTSLRTALPGMQFIATTHQPLCLRGLGAGEVVVMQKDEEDNIVPVTSLPSPSDFRVDQLLTSEFFGLNSIVDPDVERLFDEYYALLALKELNEEQAKSLEVLQGQLKDRRYLGNTLRENLMYEAIDRLVARQKTGQRQPITDVKQEAVNQVSQIWKEAVGKNKES